MDKIEIVLQITDKETVEEYADTRPDLIFKDLVNGYLMGEVELVRITKK